MYHCDFCNRDFESREQLAGHRSGHVRKGEIPKIQRLEKVGPFSCKDCDREFSSASGLGGHRITHQRTVDDVKDYHTKKKYILLELGHKCQICNLSEWMGQQIPIQIDHIDGDPDNNTRENLRLLCPNCHAQTDTYAGKNVGKAGETRRKAKMRKYGSYR
jgi:5-methylcytosine-specific restriction endonuclease McrA